MPLQLKRHDDAHARGATGVIDRYHVIPGGYLRWLVCDREDDDEVVAVERSFELAQGTADDLNREDQERASRT
jgi:hypothetical protein